MSQTTPRQTLPSTTGPLGNPEIPSEGRLIYKYEIIFFWSNADDSFVAEVPELPGCMAHGATQEVALRNINEAMALWLDTTREFGDPIPEPKGESLMLA